MISLLRVIILIFLIEIIIGICFFNKNPRKYFLLILHSFGGIFCSLPIFFYFYQKQSSISDFIPFILVGLVLYTSTLIFLCLDLIKEKKSIIYKKVQDRIDSWK